MSYKEKIRLAVFASGSGTNAAKIIERFRQHPTIKVALIAGNKATAGVWDIARAEGLDTLLLDKVRFQQEDGYVPVLQDKHIDWVILAGFLWKVPPPLIFAYPAHILNIHPSLLPKFGGRGMYGHFVHEAVIAAGEAQSGITIHLVDEQYDHGRTVFQAVCKVDPGETPASLALKIQGLEHRHFSDIIEQQVVNQ